MASTGTISFGGLLSGLDTKDIVEQLVDLKKKQLITPLENRIDQLKKQKTSLDPIEKAFDAVYNRAKKLRASFNSVWEAKTTSSGDTDVVSISSTNSTKAQSGTYNISAITALAQADRIIFNGVANKDTSQFGTNTITITYEGTAHNITIDSTNNTLEGIMTAINDEGVGVTASIINDGNATNPYRLVLTSDDTGLGSAFTHNIDTKLSLVVDGAASTLPANEARDAAFTLNGISMTSSNNTITDAIQGVTFTLLAVSNPTVAITVKQDTDTIVAGIEDFIEAYNDVREEMRKALLPDDETGELGILASDITLSTANIEIANIMGTTFRGLAGYTYKTLAGIGITGTETGTLEIDTSALKSAINSSIINVRYIFQGTDNEDGIAEKMYDYTDTLVNPIGTFVEKEKNANRSIRLIESQMEDRQYLLDKYEERLTARFNSLEKAIAGLNLKKSQIESFAGIYSSSSNQLL